jgi:IS5 family transposase
MLHSHVFEFDSHYQMRITQKKCSLMRIRNVFLSERKSKYELQWASNRVCASPSERLTFNSQYQSVFYINLKQNDIAQY